MTFRRTRTATRRHPPHAFLPLPPRSPVFTRWCARQFELPPPKPRSRRAAAAPQVRPALAARQNSRRLRAWRRRWRQGQRRQHWYGGLDSDPEPSAGESRQDRDGPRGRWKVRMGRGEPGATPRASSRKYPMRNIRIGTLGACQTRRGLWRRERGGQKGVGLGGYATFFLSVIDGRCGLTWTSSPPEIAGPDVDIRLTLADPGEIY